MSAIVRRGAAWWSLLAITLFQAVSAIGGGIGLLVTDGLGMPHSMLPGAPFDSFVWPGVILIAVVGGTQTMAAVSLILQTESALFWTAVAGLGMLIWIFVETALIREASWLQAVYFTTGVAQLTLVLVLEGITRALPWSPRRHHRATWRVRR